MDNKDKFDDQNPIERAAHGLLESGLSVIPIKSDGSKSPAVSWKPYQSEIATPEELKGWFQNGNGIGIVCGTISGNLEVLDFDTTSEQTESLNKEWEALVKKSPGGKNLVEKLVKVRTPGKPWAEEGFQYLYRCPDGVEGGKKLAQGSQRDEKQQKWIAGVLIETRGEGNYVVATGSPPETHPKKKRYEIIQGDLASIPEITKEERETLLACARALDRWKVSEHYPKNLCPLSRLLQL